MVTKVVAAIPVSLSFLA
jgi:hypothetical protein